MVRRKLKSQDHVFIYNTIDSQLYWSKTIGEDRRVYCRGNIGAVCSKKIEGIMGAVWKWSSWAEEHAKLEELICPHGKTMLHMRSTRIQTKRLRTEEAYKKSEKKSLGWKRKFGIHNIGQHNTKYMRCNDAAIYWRRCEHERGRRRMQLRWADGIRKILDLYG